MIPMTTSNMLHIASMVFVSMVSPPKRQVLPRRRSVPVRDCTAWDPLMGRRQPTLLLLTNLQCTTVRSFSGVSR